MVVVVSLFWFPSMILSPFWLQGTLLLWGFSLHQRENRVFVFPLPLCLTSLSSVVGTLYQMNSSLHL